MTRPIIFSINLYSHSNLFLCILLQTKNRKVSKTFSISSSTTAFLFSQKMASKMNSFALFCLVLMWAFSSTTVESASRQAAPAPAVDCNNLVLNLADCLSFVTNGSTEKKPQGTCCSGLKMVLKTDAECLCEGFKNSAQLGVVLNVTKAMALPAACHVSAPSVSNCGCEFSL